MYALLAIGYIGVTSAAVVAGISMAAVTVKERGPWRWSPLVTVVATSGLLAAAALVAIFIIDARLGLFALGAALSWLAAGYTSYKLALRSARRQT